MPKQTYDEWMNEVDDLVWKAYGCSVHDLEDFCSRDMYDAGRSAVSAAKKAIKASSMYY